MPSGGSAQKRSRNNRNAYQEIYRKVKENDKYIARMYNDITGSKYILTLQGLLAHKVISEADLKGFSEKTQDDILKIMNILRDD